MKIFKRTGIILLTICFIVNFFSNHAVSASENPFEEHDKNFQQIIKESKYSYNQLPNISSAAKQRQSNAFDKIEMISYIVTFKNDRSLQEISTLLKGINYRVVGVSERRTFAVKSNSGIEALKKRFGDSLKSIEEDKITQLIEKPSEPISSSQSDAIAALSVPNDEFYNTYEWQLSAMNIPKAWDIQSTASNIYISVIDSGIFRGHEDLTGAIIKGGYDVIDGDYVTYDSAGHGTCVTGIIAATCNNKIGIAGVAGNKVVIVPVRVLDANGKGKDSDIIEAIYFSVYAGCKIINLSLGGTQYSKAFDDAIQYAYQNGCIIVAAAGNSGDDPVVANRTKYSYPASFDHVISVGSVKKSLSPSSFSTYNNKVDIAAPGELVATTVDYKTGYAYASVSGTSFASPCVAGVAALTAAYYPNITPDQFEQILKSSATDIYSKGFDTKTGYGLINAYAILKLQAPKITASADNGNAILKWNAVPGATSYKVFSYDSASKAYKTLATTTTLSYTQSGLINGKSYIYLVRAYKGTIGSPYTTANHISVKPISAPVVSATASDKTVTLKWGKVAGATSYKIYSYDSSKKSFTPLTTVTNTNYTISGLTNGILYTYLVRAYNGSYWSTYTSANLIKAMPIAAPSVKAAAGDGKVTLSWTAVAGAKSYKIFTYDSISRKYSTLAVVTGTSYVHMGLTNGKAYTYLVRAYNGLSWSAYTTANHVTARPKK